VNPIDIPALNAWLASQGCAGRIAVKQVVIEDDPFPALQEFLKVSRAVDRPVLVVMDHTAMRRGDADAKRQFLSLLNGACRPEVIQLGTPAEPPHADLRIAEELAVRLPPGCLLISFGSGTVTDLAKHACFLADQRQAEADRRCGGEAKERAGGAADGRIADAQEGRGAGAGEGRGRGAMEVRAVGAGESRPAGGRPFICVPTACTVTAFSSALAVLGVAGVKRTIPSRSPDATWVDLNVLADAPPDLTRAGVGDLLARGVAYADWYLSGLLGIDESYTDVPRMLLADHEARLPEIAAAVGQGERGAYRSLMEALLLAGYGMSVVGATTPISGWEHVMSHYLDLCNGALGRPLNLHGLQVAAGSFVATRAYNSLLRNVTAAELSAAADVDLGVLAKSQIAEHFAAIDPSGRIRAELLRDYLPKAERWRAAAGRLRDLAAEWPSGQVGSELSSRLMPLERMNAIAAALGLPQSPTALESLPSTTAAVDAVRFSHLVRRRFTLGDLLSALGWLEPGRVARWLEAD
jgi:glycerol-1-phosphate dehydrogenase [NAD(P)+]